MANRTHPERSLSSPGLTRSTIFDRPQRFDNELQVDPELQEGPASASKVALFAVGIALVLGAVFYGLNNTSVKEAQTAPPAQTAQTQPAAPQGAPPGMRDVTPQAQHPAGHDDGFGDQPPDAAAGRAAGTNEAVIREQVT